MSNVKIINAFFCCVFKIHQVIKCACDNLNLPGMTFLKATRSVLNDCSIVVLEKTILKKIKMYMYVIVDRLLITQHWSGVTV